jgi:uncharacterized protein YbjT (DUF2867 family)
MPVKNPGLDVARNDHADKNPRILILGSTGRIGKAAIAKLEQSPDFHQAVYASRNRAQVDAWRREGKEAALRTWIARNRQAVLEAGHAGAACRQHPHDSLIGPAAPRAAVLVRQSGISGFK